MHSEHVKKSYAKFFKILFDSLPQKLLIFISFALFIFVTTYKITNASLWFDEGVEYLVSTKLFSQMISAINTTYQPPLYNFIMHLLLKISLSEYWFRLTSALFGIIGCLGLYFTLKELKGRIFACIGIFAYTFLRNVVYYNQECAEYSLLICCLLWFTYFFICLLKEFTISKCVLFVISGILSVYSQYGAVFPVAGL
ncbi:MAG: glycosyltransferase family 39 protein, partial [Eubacteriaceae bacterium]